MEEKMNEFKILFPEWKEKALTFSYDDAQIHDRRLVDIFDKYHMKATFHVNSSRLGKEGYIAKEEVKELYRNHEVACHGVTHPFFNKLSPGQTVLEIDEDRRALEESTGKIVRGMSYPFGEYNDDLIRVARDLGIVYSRTTEATMNFNFPSDFMKWHPTCHHNKVTDELIDAFLNHRWNPVLFYIWGHSFEFDRNNDWDKMISICEKLQGRENIWYATNIEIYEYVTAIRSLVTSADGRILYNPTSVPLWLLAGERQIKLMPGMEMTL